jgi:endonuclease III
VWWHCGYPASDAACARGWASLQSRVGVDPERLLAASHSHLAAALKPGGMVPELRALRLKAIAERVQKEFGGDLAAALKRLSAGQARAALRKFPGIGNPGADRILLFGGLLPVAAVPSNCPHVVVRIERGREPENYGRTYAQAQEIVAAQAPENFAARARAYLLLQHHGQQLCKRSGPKCAICPLASRCAFAAPKSDVKAV